jgi:hypothetical protein
VIGFDDNGAAAARAAEDQRRLMLCDAIEDLIAGVRDQFPDVHICALPDHLQEPQRSQLVALLAEADWMEDSHE